MVALTRSQARKKTENEAPGEGIAEPVQDNACISQPIQRRRRTAKQQLNKTVNSTKKIAESRDNTSHLPPPVSQSPILVLDATSRPSEPSLSASQTPTEESHSLSPSLPDAPPNSPDNSYNLSPASHSASQVTQSSPNVPDAPPITSQPVYSASQDIQSSPQVMQSPPPGLTAPPNTPLLSSVILKDLSDRTHPLPQTPEASPNTPFSSPVCEILPEIPLSSPQAPNAPDNSYCSTVEVHSEVPHSPVQIVKSSPKSSKGLPASLVASPYRFDSVVELPSSPPEVIQSPSKDLEGSPASLVASQYVSESELELPSSPPEVSQSPPKDPEGSPATLVASSNVYVSESEPEHEVASSAPGVYQSPSKDRDGSPASLIASSKVYVSEPEPELPSSVAEEIQSTPNSPEGSQASLVHSVCVSESSPHGSGNQNEVLLPRNGSLGDTQMSPKLPQHPSEDPTQAFGWHPPDRPARTQSAPYERFDYSSDTPREPAEPTSSDRILWDASDMPREAPIVARDLYPERVSPEVKLEEVTPTMQELQQNGPEQEDDHHRAISSPSPVDDAGSFMPSPVEPPAAVGAVGLTVDALNRFNAAQPDYMDGDLSDDDEDLDDTKLTQFPTYRYARVDPKIIQDYRAFGAAQLEAQAMKDAAEAPKQNIENQSQVESEVDQEDEFEDADPPSPIQIEGETVARFESGEGAESVESWIARSLPPLIHDLLQYDRRDISSEQGATMWVWTRLAMRTPIDERNPSLLCLQPAHPPSSPIMTSQEHVSNLQGEKDFLIGRFQRGRKGKKMAAWIEGMGEWFDKHIGPEKACIGAHVSMLLDEVRPVAVAYIVGEEEDDEKASLLRKLSQYDPDGSPAPRFEFEHAVRQQHLLDARPDENDRLKEHRLLGTDYSKNQPFKRLRHKPEELPKMNSPLRQEEGYQPSLPVPPAKSNLRVWPHHPAPHSGPESPDGKPDPNDNGPDPQQGMTHKRRRSDGTGDGHYDDQHKRRR